MKPVLINNLEMAKSQEALIGEMDAKTCERLLDVVDKQHQDALKIQYRLVGQGLINHLPSLQLTLDAQLPLVCQRCLEHLLCDISLTLDYVVSKEEPESIEEDDEVDWLELSRKMNLNELIEDELLIAMPFAPTHEEACKSLKLESGEKHNPFAQLKGLVK